MKKVAFLITLVTILLPIQVPAQAPPETQKPAETTLQAPSTCPAENPACNTSLSTTPGAQTGKPDLGTLLRGGGIGSAIGTGGLGVNSIVRSPLSGRAIDR